jgi:hypothetical protein
MNTRQKSMIIGAVVGASLGVLGGYLFTRGFDLHQEGRERQTLSLRTVPPGDLVKLFIAVMGVLRGVAELGERA